MRRFWICTLIAWCVPAAAMAQNSSWGVAGSITPRWSVPSNLGTVFGGNVDIRGSDVTIGVARGRELGGDWSVSYVHKKIRDGSRVEDLGQFCPQTNACFTEGELSLTRGVTIDGIEAHKFVPFATIKRRVQVGMNFGGGIGSFKRDLEHHEFSADFVSADPRTGQMTFRQREEVTTTPAKELFPLSFMPLGTVQVAVGVIAAPGVKIRAAGGLSFPGTTSFSLTGVYLFGAR